MLCALTIQGAAGAEAPEGSPATRSSATTEATPAASTLESPGSILQRPNLTGDWFGARTLLDDKAGIKFTGDITLADTKTFFGSNTRGAASRSLLNLNFTIDTGKLLNIPGGTFFVEFQNENGQIAQQLAGAAQPLNVIDTDGRTEVDQLWYQQSLFDDKLRIKAGKIDANVDFALPLNSNDLLGGNFTFSPTILGFPTYPDPSTGFSAFVSPNEHLTVGFGIFDGATLLGNPTGPRGPATFGRASAGFLMVGEIDLKWTLADSPPGRLELGAWGHTGHLARFDGSTESGTAGPYLVFDQSLWRKNPDTKDDARGIGVFAQYGWADPQVSPIIEHIAFGIQYTGPLPTRDADVLGLGVSQVYFSPRASPAFPHGGETLVELFYQMHVTPWFTIQPDLQYLNTPSGRSRDGMAGTVQAVITF